MARGGSSSTPRPRSHLPSHRLCLGAGPLLPVPHGMGLGAACHRSFPPPRGSCLNNLGTQGNAGTRSHGAAAGGGLGPPPCCSQTVRARKQTPSPSWGRGRPGLGAAGPLGRGGGGAPRGFGEGGADLCTFAFCTLPLTLAWGQALGAGGCPRRAPGQTPPQTFLLPAGLRGPWGAPSPRPPAAQPLLFLYSL